MFSVYSNLYSNLGHKLRTLGLFGRHDESSLRSCFFCRTASVMSLKILKSKIKLG